MVHVRTYYKMENLKTNRSQKKKILDWIILEEKMCAFMRDVRMKNITATHMYHGDSSMLTERKCNAIPP
jgi:hypothetical protein